MKKKIVIFVLLFGLFALLSGCAGAEIDKFFSLPLPQKEFLQLQELINTELASGSEYSAPTQGSLRQSVQMVNLDGVGEAEALAFFRSPEQVPKICIYQNNEGAYELATTIVGDGSAIGRVEYADLDGDGISEILVTWRESSEMRIVKAYSLVDWANAVLFTANCTDFQVGDIHKDGDNEVFVLNFVDKGGLVTMYSVEESGEVVQTDAKLSAALTGVDRFRVSSIAEGVPAIYVEGHYAEDETDWYVTDVLVALDGKLKNITLDEAGENSSAKRKYKVFSTDIDGRGNLEVPFAEKLPGRPDAVTEFFVFDWMSYHLDGSSSLCASTYHCYSDGWYYALPDDWRENFSIRREAGVTGEKTTVFSNLDADGKPEDLLTIYTMTDENRRDKAKLPGRFTLLSSPTTIYSAKLGDGSEVSEEKKQEIVSRFHLIYSEWLPGSV